MAKATRGRRGRPKNVNTEASTTSVNDNAAIDELDFLAIFCDNFNKYDEDAKERIMDFLSGKYRKYIHYSPKQ